MPKESLKAKKKRVLKLIDILKARYPDAICSLDYASPLELLVSVRLAAQCTDARVNLVTPALFQRYPTLESLANAEITELEELIRPCGFYHSKARDIIGACRRILEVYNGVVPDTMEELLTLPGVGRKSANLILGDVYGKPAIVVDTHCIRITNRLGLVSEQDPTKIEFALAKILPPEESNNFCHRLVLFGREICTARNPKCGECPLAELCPKIIKKS